jgi:peptide/nickel transport system permease protein
MTTLDSPAEILDQPTTSHLSIESYGARARRRFRRSRSGMVGAVLVAIVLLCALLAPVLAPYDPTVRDPSSPYSPPQALRFDGSFYTHPLLVELDPKTFLPTFVPDQSRRCVFSLLGEGWRTSLFGLPIGRHLLSPMADCPSYLLGTDGQGRDLLSRILIGSRLTLLMAGLVVAISVVVGTLIGLISGFAGGILDEWLQRLTDVVLALPELPLYLALVALVPRNADPISVFILLVVILSLLRWASLAREIRGKAMALRAAEYVRAAEAVGSGSLRILLKHILPNVMSHVIVSITLMIPSIVLAESFLSFLGIGVQPPLVSWGLLLNAAKELQTLGSHPWLLLPVVGILVTVLGFNMFGDGLRDAIDPHG